MKILNPCIITPRLLPGIKIDTAFVSVDYSGYEDGRVVYKTYIDLPDYQYESTDLKSGITGGNLQSGLESLLVFLGAFAESRSIGNKNSENWDLFPDELAEFATQNSDEIWMLHSELDWPNEFIIE
jgi:hypothetical protein